MSDFARKLQPSFVSYEALEVACHALENYCDRLKESDLQKLKVCFCKLTNAVSFCKSMTLDFKQVHCYRATLETLLARLDPPVRRAGLRSVKNAHLLSFQDYVQKGTRTITSIFYYTSLSYITDLI